MVLQLHKRPITETRSTTIDYSVIVLMAVFVITGGMFLLSMPAALAPDAVSYLSIAKDYAGGRWGEAINSYWGPLMSWLLAPLLALHVPDNAALKTVAFLAGLVAFAGVIALSRRFAVTRAASIIELAIAGLMITGMMLGPIPDLLLTSILLFYLAVLLGRRYPNSIGAAVFCGSLGAVGYFTKVYAFFFFAVHFTLANTFYWLRSAGDARAQFVKNWIAGFAAFAILTAPWIAAISWKEGKPIVSTSGSYNYRLVGPMSMGYSHLQGLVPPPHADSITAWEDPNPESLPPWNPLMSAGAFHHQVVLVQRNAARIALFLMHVSPLLIVILPGYVVFSMKRDGSWFGEWVIPVMTMFLYVAGYLLVSVEDRYLYITAFLLLLMAFRAYSGTLMEQVRFSGVLRVALLIVLAGSFCITPVRSLATLPRRDAVAAVAERLAETKLLHGKLASCGSWDKSLKIANRLGLPYYGVVGPGAQGRELAGLLNPEAAELPWTRETPERSEQQLRDNRIDYLLLWNDCAAPPLSLRFETEIPVTNDLGLRIYRLDHRSAR